MDDLKARAYAALLVLSGEVEKALEILSEYYGVTKPKLVVGLPKRAPKNIAGCYDPRKETIYVKSREELNNPFVILHEFYHHLRFFMGKHRGTEKHANKFAREAIEYLAKMKNT